jgi:hypothetical protein
LRKDGNSRPSVLYSPKTVTGWLGQEPQINGAAGATELGSRACARSLGSRIARARMAAAIGMRYPPTLLVTPTIRPRIAAQEMADGQGEHRRAK